MRPDSDTLRAQRDAAIKSAKQDRCKHQGVHSSSVTTPDGVWTHAFCNDCGKVWRSAEKRDESL